MYNKDIAVNGNALIFVGETLTRDVLMCYIIVCYIMKRHIDDENHGLV